jgi:hypothetical protein
MDTGNTFPISNDSARASVIQATIPGIERRLAGGIMPVGD